MSRKIGLALGRQVERLLADLIVAEAALGRQAVENASVRERLEDWVIGGLED